MAGTLVLNAESDWLPAGWAFDSVLDGVADEVAPHDARLAATIRVARTEGGAGYLDLRSWNAESVRLFLNAATAVRGRKLAAGASAFHDPRGFPRYMSWLEELIAMVQRDPRVGRR